MFSDLRWTWIGGGLGALAGGGIAAVRARKSGKSGKALWMGVGLGAGIGALAGLAVGRGADAIVARSGASAKAAESATPAAKKASAPRPIRLSDAVDAEGFLDLEKVGDRTVTMAVGEKARIRPGYGRLELKEGNCHFGWGYLGDRDINEVLGFNEPKNMAEPVLGLLSGPTLPKEIRFELVPGLKPNPAQASNPLF